MKNTNEIRIKTCPRCGAMYGGAPALSRQDNETLICPDCGTREALESLGVGAEEQESILETIHRSQRERS
jgi:uncharacterized Zn finger protein (UPF0148 family)|nr:MAG TPA: hypothetical protein [Caudoviricetes sp.]